MEKLKEPKDYFTKKMRSKGMRYSIYEGTFATIMVSVTTASFVTAFALVLGANDLIIGLITSIPLILWTIIQIPAAIYVERTGNRKRLSYICAFISRFMWIPIGLLAIFLFPNNIILLIVFLTISSVFGAIIGPAWASWMGDLVPLKIRGKYFGKRNVILNIFVILSTILAGVVLWIFPKTDTTGFAILFLIGGIAGIISSFFLKATPEPLFKRVERSETVTQELKNVLSNKRFRIFLLAFLFWNTAVSIAAPFFVVRLLRDLGASYIWVSIEIIIATTFTLLSVKFWGRYGDMFGNKVVIAITAFGATLVPFMWLFITEPWQVIPLEIVSGIFWGGFNLAVFNYVLEISPQERRPTYSALFWVTMGIGGIVGPIIGGLLAEHYASQYLLIFTGLQVVFVVSFVLRVICAFVFLYVMKEVENREKVETGYVLGEMMRGRWIEKMHNLHITGRKGVKAISLSGYGFKKTMNDISDILSSIKKSGIKISDSNPKTTKKFFKTVDDAHKTSVRTIKIMPTAMKIMEESELEGDAERVKKEIIRTKYELKEKADMLAQRQEPLNEKEIKKLTNEIHVINKKMGNLTYDVRKFEYHYKKKREFL